MRRVLLLLLLSSPLIVSKVGPSLSRGQAKAFVNGQWFTGKHFQSTTFYAVDGILTRRKPADPVQTVDLQKGFVVPAFADAHNHFPSSKQDLASANRAFLDAGVFYVLNAGGMRNLLIPFEHNWRRPLLLTSSSHTLCLYVPA